MTYKLAFCVVPNSYLASHYLFASLVVDFMDMNVNFMYADPSVDPFTV